MYLDHRRAYGCSGDLPIPELGARRPEGPHRLDLGLAGVIRAILDRQGSRSL